MVATSRDRATPRELLALEGDAPMDYDLALRALGLTSAEARLPQARRRAWKRAALLHHPDRCPGDLRAGPRFVRAERAAELLERCGGVAPTHASTGPQRVFVRPEEVIESEGALATRVAFTVLGVVLLQWLLRRVVPALFLRLRRAAQRGLPRPLYRFLAFIGNVLLTLLRIQHELFIDSLYDW
mmetsp:Transcript_60399/g.129528  ORF Transcript_60399/g.129528 Transcript_60399/m.129528 type:complete len:184 (+) Transcript_60399:156-707(+)